VRIVADTNVIVSAFLWGGTPRRLLDAVQAGSAQLFTSRALITELEDVLLRAKFAERLKRTHFSAAFLLARYTQLAILIAPADLTAPVLRDPDDTALLACALAARAEAIVSGDQDLLVLNPYQNIRIVSAAQALQLIGHTA
jgi:putative PIN family toxin of toxin-antitoxin system